MDELRLNKVFAGFLFAALLLMAGVKIADVLVPHQELAENAYVIEVAETTDIAAAAPVDTGPEPIERTLSAGGTFQRERGCVPPGFGSILRCVRQRPGGRRGEAAPGHLRRRMPGPWT